MIFIFIVIDIIKVLLFIKPLFKKENLKDGYSVKFFSPIWQYITFGLTFLAAFVFLLYYIIQNEFIGIVYFNLLFLVSLEELSKSYVIFCKKGLFLDGLFFTYDEKKEFQYVTKIMIWQRRIYAINTTNKYAYIFLKKKYVNRILERNI